MRKRQKITLLVLSILAVIMTVLLVLSRRCPGVVTQWYTGKIFPVVTLPLRFIANLTPFSLAELLFIGCILGILVGGIVRIARSVRYGTWRPFLKGLYHIAILLLSIVILFPVVGGFNYSRQTFAQMAAFQVAPATVEELETLCSYLGTKAATERNILPQDEQGITQSPLTIMEIMDAAQEGYNRVGRIYPWLSGDYGTPKIAVHSWLMSYLRISGIYPYLVPEAIVNIHTPIMSLPHTVCHEMAHQRGIAREDEANFVGYLAAIHHSEAIFRYSGYLEAYIYSMDALYQANPTRWAAVRKMTHSGILRDIAYIHSVWAPYTSSNNVIGEISTHVNDWYLKENAVEDGVQSYGRMVDLLIAYQKHQGM